MMLDHAGERRILDGHRDKITSVVAVGTTLVSADRAGVVRFWAQPSPQHVVAGQASSEPATTAGGWVVGLETGELQRMTADAPPFVIGTLPGPVVQVAASPQRDVIAAATRDRFTGWVDGKRLVDVPAAPLRVCVSENGEYVGLLGEPGKVQVWSTRTGELLVDAAEAGEFLVILGTHAYTAVPSGVIAFDLAAPAPRRGVLHPAPFDPNLAAPLPDGRLAIASTSGAVQILDGTMIDLGHQLLSVYADGQWISAGGGDGTIYRWRPSDGARAELRGGHERWVHGVTGSHGAAHIASWSWAAPTLRIWRVTDGAIAYVPTLEPMLGAAYSMDGTQLAITDRSGTIRIVPDELERQDPLPPGGLATYVHQHLRGAR
jgi:hypothetical protein